MFDRLTKRDWIEVALITAGAALAIACCGWPTWWLGAPAIGLVALGATVEIWPG